MPLGFAHLAPGMDRDPRRRYLEIARQDLGAHERAVDDPDLGDPGVGQRRHHRPRRSARPEDYRRTPRRPQLWHRFSEVLAKPEDVGIASFESTVGHDYNGLNRTNATRRGLDPV